jgi:N-acetylglutamate synthase-like GNAT family acetyltransferase
MLARSYEITDRTACLGIFDSNAPDYVRPEERIQFEQFLDRLPGPYLVVMDDDQLVACGGFATGRIVGEADIRWILVDRDHHGHGVGDFLMTTCVSEILALEHIHTARLETSQRTRAFFERWGFASVEVVPSGLGPGLDQVEMRSALANGGRAHWLEMITGGLPPPDVEQPIPAIEHYKEWIAHRYAPGHYLGGNLEPHLDQTRIGPRGKRLCGLLLGVSAAVSTLGVAAFGVEYSPAEVVGFAVLIGIQWFAAIRMYQRGTVADNH